MDSVLAAHFERIRLARKLKPSQLARLAGYRNIGKQCINIETFEAAGWVHPDMLRRLATALDVKPVVVLRLMQEDWLSFVGEWYVWATTPVAPMLAFPFFMAVETVMLPPTICTLNRAEGFASTKAGERGHWARLVLSRRFSVDFDSTGTVTKYREVIPATWIWQHEPTTVRVVTKERIASLFSWPGVGP
jgi:hypothetical protein